MSSQFPKHVSVVICTRNRAASLERLLNCAAFESSLVQHLIVVDSSSESSESEKNEKLVLRFPQGVLLRSAPGLPRQRNAGSAYLAEVLGLQPSEVICYLDDDVTVPNDYFQKVLTFFQRQDLILGAWDKTLRVIPDTKLRRVLSWLGLVSTASFSISRAGATTAGTIKEDMQHVEWIPGHSFSMVLRTWSTFGFNEKIRMTGEDLEFQLRAQPTTLVMSRSLKVDHHREESGRGSMARVAYEEALFRFFLSNRYPSRFDATRVLFLNLVLGMHAGLIRGDLRAAWALIWACLEYLCFRPLHLRTMRSLGFHLEDARE